MSVLQATNLTKVYPSPFKGSNIRAVDSLTLEVGEGTVFGLLGGNGAGKTTLIKLILSIIKPTSGTFTLFEQPGNRHDLRARIGYLPENHRIPPFLTAKEFLYYFGSLSGIDPAYIKTRIEETLKLVGLSLQRDKKVKTFSKGMQQRLCLAQAVIHNPDLIFLDEPTDGIDPVGRKEIRDFLLELKNQGKTIFLNSHILSEVELICDSVAIINKGVLVKKGLVSDLTANYDEYVIKTGNDLREVNYSGFASGFNITLKNNSELVLQKSELEDLNRLIDEMRKQNILIKEISPVRKTLEEIYITALGENEGVKN